MFGTNPSWTSPDADTMYEMFVQLLESMIRKPAFCTGGLHWENSEGAGDGFD